MTTAKVLAESGANLAPQPREPGSPPELGVYVHFPWCLAKCPYCDFLSVPTDRASVPHRAYADAVLAELARRAEALGARRVKTIFFGGGTPSLWEPAELGRVLDAIRRTFPTDGAIEVTVECNPTSFDEGRARALLDRGVNRVSIGVQSLDRDRLRFLGRLHDPEGALRAVRAAVASGVPRVSADLIFGLPEQAPEAAAHEATVLAELGLTHLSAYALTIEPNTQFGSLAKKGKLPLAREDHVADAFLAVDRTLERAGFEHYEISNYARDGHYAEHNLRYWRGDEYLGIGVGAWGTVRSGEQRIRYRNTPALERYLAVPGDPSVVDFATHGPGRFQSEIEPIDGETALRERLLLGLRLAAGIDVEAHARELGVAPWPEERARAARRLIERGRLRQEGPRLTIPRDSWLLSDGTIAELL